VGAVGTLVYSTYLGGSGGIGGGDWGSSISVDNRDDAYVTGWTQSKDFPIKNAFQRTLNGYSNAFVTKIDAADCALVYSSFLGGSSQDYGFGIAVDGSGNAYVAGVTSSRDFPTKDPFQDELKGFSNAFVTKISAK
jgi:hypothetical protein